MKLISIFLMSFFILAACSQKKETFSLDCESQTQITVEGEAPYVLASKEKEDFIDNKYGVNKHSCPIWTDEKIECENSSQDSSFKMTYDRKTGAYKKISSDVLFGKKRNFSTSGTCKVIPARTTTEMMQAPAQAPEPANEASLQAQSQSNLINTMRSLDKEYEAYLYMQPGTREREEKQKAWEAKKNAFMAAEIGKKVDGWSCFPSYIKEKETLLKVEKELYCPINKNMSESEVIHLKIKPSTQILFDKVYRGDQLKFSGTILSLKTGWPLMIYLDADSIEQAK
jgi:hypothetical protein